MPVLGLSSEAGCRPRPATPSDVPCRKDPLSRVRQNEHGLGSSFLPVPRSALQVSARAFLSHVAVRPAKIGPEIATSPTVSAYEKGVFESCEADFSGHGANLDNYQLPRLAGRPPCSSPTANLRYGLALKQTPTNMPLRHCRSTTANNCNCRGYTGGDTCHPLQHCRLSLLASACGAAHMLRIVPCHHAILLIDISLAGLERRNGAPNKKWQHRFGLLYHICCRTSILSWPSMRPRRDRHIRLHKGPRCCVTGPWKTGACVLGISRHGPFSCNGPNQLAIPRSGQGQHLQPSASLLKNIQRISDIHVSCTLSPFLHSIGLALASMP